MKVECIKVINPIIGEESHSDGWLTVGQTYIVLAIFASPQRPIKFRCIGNDGKTPALFDARQFKTISTNIPSNWVATLDEQGILEIGPERWSNPGFWEDFFNGDLNAIRVFEEEYAIIVRDA